MSQRTHNTKGMTLLEVVVFVGLLVFILIGIIGALRFTYQGQRFAFEQADATRSARAGIERAVRDLREASYADDGAYPIEALTTTSAIFFSDYDNDGKIERIRYFLDGTNLKRGIVDSAGDPPTYSAGTEVVSTISDNVRNEAVGVPLFTYYDSTGAELADLAEVDELAFVLVRLVVNVHPERAPIDYELRSSAALRNVH